MKKILLTIIAGIIFSSFATQAFAVVQLNTNLKPSNLPEITTNAEATSTDHPETAATQTAIVYIGSIIARVLLFAGAMTVIFIIIAGAKYIMAFGNDDLLGQAKRGITWSLAGLILIMLSYTIVRGVIQVLISTDNSVT